MTGSGKIKLLEVVSLIITCWVPTSSAFHSISPTPRIRIDRPYTSSHHARVGLVILCSQNDSAIDTATDDDAKESSKMTNNLWKKLRQGFARGKQLDRAAIAGRGAGFFLSYGCVSNVSGSIAVAVSWYLSSKRSGLSPLAPGQWKGFLAIFASFYGFLNVIRPARMAVAVYLSGYYEKIIAWMQNKFNCNKAMAIFLVVFFINFGTSLLMFAGGVSLASILSGVPWWVR